MMAALGCFALAAVVAAVLTPIVRGFALRRGLLDHATIDRKIHVGRIPRLGGIAIIFAFYASLTCVIAWFLEMGGTPRADRPGSYWVLVGGFAIALLGVYDDLRGADAKTKFLVQFVVASALYATGFRIDRITTPFGSFLMGPLSFPFTILWIVGVTNAVNLIDGLDGLAGGVAFIAVSAVFAISAMRHETFMMVVTAALGGSVLGFLVYNFNPASIFMGDAGSMFLGFMIATTSIRASQKASTAVAILLPIIVLAIPIADTALAVMRRALRGQGLFTGDREHIHHRLLDSGLSHRQAVVALYAISIACGVAAVTLFVAQDRVAILAVGATLMLSTCLLFRRLAGLRQYGPTKALPRTNPLRFVRTIRFSDAAHAPTPATRALEETDGPARRNADHSESFRRRI